MRTQRIPAALPRQRTRALGERERRTPLEHAAMRHRRLDRRKCCASGLARTTPLAESSAIAGGRYAVRPATDVHQNEVVALLDSEPIGSSGGGYTSVEPSKVRHLLAKAV